MAQGATLVPIFLQQLFIQLRHPAPPLRVVALLVALLCYGTTGFVYFEQPARPELGFIDGLWYTTVTLTTVGYGDLAPASIGGRLLVAVPLMLVGIGLLGYVLSVAASSLVQSKTKELHGMGAHQLEQHLIILNFPSLPKLERLLDELVADPAFGKARAVVLVDEDLQELPAELAQRGVRFVRGGPTREETLRRASLDHAAFAIVLSKRPGDPHSDDLNVAVTLALESGRRNIYTVVECVDYSTEELLRKAGCDAIVCTSRFDAHFLSHEMLHPGVQEVIEQLTSNLGDQQVQLTPYRGSETTYGELVEACKTSGHTAIGLRRQEASEFNLAGDQVVRPGDRIISIGAGRLKFG
jgi:voltage-gated potassium channel